MALQRLLHEPKGCALIAGLGDIALEDLIFLVDRSPKVGQELALIYEQRGVDLATARLVADQMMANDALAAHARDELGLSGITAARPLEAALTSALTFTASAAAPLAVVPLAPVSMLVRLLTGRSSLK